MECGLGLSDEHFSDDAAHTCYMLCVVDLRDTGQSHPTSYPT